MMEPATQRRMKQSRHESIHPNVFRLFCFAILLCLTAELTTGSAAEIPAKEFVSYFRMVALSRTPPTFVRWSSTISAVISGRYSASQLATVSASLGEVAKAANIGLSIRRDDGKLTEPANLNIAFLGQDDVDLRLSVALRNMHLRRKYEDILDQILSMPIAESRGAGDFYEDHGITRYACIYVIGADDAGQIKRAMLVVNPDLPSSSTNVCILQGTLHVFGLRLPLPGSIVAIPSALKSMNSANNLTDLDLRLIRTLYSVQLRPGMPSSAVLRIVEDMANTDQ
jgi:hypothetical protein